MFKYMKCFHFSVLLVAIFFCATQIFAQTTTALKTRNASISGRFGNSVAGGLALDGDGIPDQVVGAPYEFNVSYKGTLYPDAGRVYFYNNGTDSMLAFIASPDFYPTGNFGYSVAVSDGVNAQDSNGVIVGAPGELGGGPTGNYVSGRVHVFVGYGYDFIRSFISPNAEQGGSFGYSVVSVGDVSGADNYDEILVGAPGEDPGGAPNEAGRAYLLNIADGSTVTTFVSGDEQVGSYFGYRVAVAGDVNNDGNVDVAISAPLDSVGNSVLAGRVYVYETDGTLLLTLESPNATNNGLFGIGVNGIGDVDGDSYDDICVDATGETQAYIFSGVDGSLLESLNYTALAGGYPSNTVAPVGDLNNNGYPDVAIGARNAPSVPFTGRVYIYDGNDGSLLYTLSSPNSSVSGSYGISVGVAGDIDSNGYEDIVIGASYEECSSEFQDHGRAYVVSFSEMDRADNHSSSKIVPSEFNFAGVFPNPTNGAIRLRFSIPETTPLSVYGYDVSGREVFRRAVTAQQGEYSLPIRLNSLSSGKYFIKWNTGIHRGESSFLYVK